MRRSLSALSRADPVRRTHWTGIVTLPGVTLFMSDSEPQPNLRRVNGKDFKHRKGRFTLSRMSRLPRGQMAPYARTAQVVAGSFRTSRPVGRRSTAPAVARDAGKLLPYRAPGPRVARPFVGQYGTQVSDRHRLSGVRAGRKLERTRMTVLVPGSSVRQTVGGRVLGRTRLGREEGDRREMERKEEREKAKKAEKDRIRKEVERREEERKERERMEFERQLLSQHSRRSNLEGSPPAARMKAREEKRSEELATCTEGGETTEENKKRKSREEESPQKTKKKTRNIKPQEKYMEIGEDKAPEKKVELVIKKMESWLEKQAKLKTVSKVQLGEMIRLVGEMRKEVKEMELEKAKL
ncbi:hypothetical protein J6590_079151 [Homalodisca vitripennis]|nr:hypothetical protein J6590_079151 [Homalodisca vitripennis]